MKIVITFRKIHLSYYAYLLKRVRNFNNCLGTMVLTNEFECKEIKKCEYYRILLYIIRFNYKEYINIGSLL